MGHVRVQLRNVEHLLRSENLTMKGKPLFLCAPLRFQFHNQLSSLMDKLTTRALQAQVEAAVRTAFASRPETF